MKKKAQTISSNSFLKAEFFQSLVIGLFHFLVISVPLFFTFNTSELFEFNKMVLTYALTAIILSAWVGRMICSQSLIIKKTFLDIPILIFLISQLLSVVFSIHPYTSLLGYYSRFHGGFVSIITYTVLYYAFVSNVERKHLPSFFLSLTGAGLLVSFYAILEHFGHSMSCYIVSGGKEFGVDCWIQDVKNRVFATFGQPNWLAAYLIMLLPVSVSLTFSNYKKSSLNIYYLVASLAFLTTLLFTQSRSGFLGAVMGMAVFCGLVFWQLSKHDQLSSFVTSSKNKLVALAIATIGIAALFGTPYSPSIGSLFKSVPQSTEPAAPLVVNRLDEGGTDSGEIRKIVWQGAIKVWQRYPIFGSGLETFAYSYYQDRPIEHNYVSEWDFLYNKAHNEFLNFLATTGIVGLGSYVLLLGYFSFYTIKKVIATSDKQSPSAHQLAAIISGVTALSVSNFFGFSTVMVTILMYLFFGLVVILTTKENNVSTNNSKLTSTSYLLLSATVLFCIFLLRIVYQYWSADVDFSKGKALLEAGYFDQGIKKIHSAISKNSQEATFYDELATQYALYAMPFAQEGKTAEAQALTVAAQEVSDATLKLNPRQLNFYKTRARTFIALAQLQPEFLHEARQSLEDGRKLAPTDPKLLYNIGIVEISLNNFESGTNALKEAIALKPNYESARLQLALAYEASSSAELALEQYTYIVENINPSHPQALERIASLSAQLKTGENK